MFADLSIGYDPSTEQVFAEVKDGKNELRRIFAGSKVRAGLMIVIYTDGTSAPSSAISHRLWHWRRSLETG